MTTGRCLWFIRILKAKRIRLVLVGGGDAVEEDMAIGIDRWDVGRL